MHNIYQSLPVVVEEVIEETPTIKTLVLRPEEEFSFATGQFIELSLAGVGEAPFTPSSDPNIKDRFEVTIMNVGRLTGQLHSLSKNMRLGVRGPFGFGYPLDEFKNREITDILQVSLETVKIRLHRARAQLKAALNDGCDFYRNEENVLACDRKSTQILPKPPK